MKDKGYSTFYDPEYYFRTRELAEKTRWMFLDLYGDFNKIPATVVDKYHKRQKPLPLNIQPELSISDNTYYKGYSKPKMEHQEEGNPLDILAVDTEEVRRRLERLEEESEKEKHLRWLTGEFAAFIEVNEEHQELFEDFLAENTIELSKIKYQKFTDVFKKISTSMNRLKALLQAGIPGMCEVFETLEELKRVSKLIDDGDFFMWFDDWKKVTSEDKKHKPDPVPMFSSEKE